MSCKQSNNTPARSSLHFLLLLLLMGTLLSCNKEPKYKTVYLDAGLKAAFNNKPGSYWIYRDSVTGELDSVYLTERILKIYTGDASIKGFNYEKLDLTFASTHIGSDTSYNLQLGINFSTRWDHYLVCGLSKISIQPLNFWFAYPFTSAGPVSKKDTIVYSRMDTPLSVGTKQFNVIAFTQSGKTNLSERSSGYWDDKVGLVKMRFLCKSSSGPAMKVLELQRLVLVK